MVKVYSLDGVTPVVHPSTFVHPTAVLIGDVVVGPNCYIAPFVSLRGDMGSLEVGAGTNIQDGCVLHSFPGAPASIGEWGHIGHGSVLHGCHIGDHALIGMNAVVMDGAVIGEEAFVGAMAFVKAGFEVPQRTLVAGVPARVVRPLSDTEIDWKRTGTGQYQQLARRSLATLRPTEALAEPEPDRPRLPVSSHDPLHVAKRKKEKEEKGESR